MRYAIGQMDEGYFVSRQEILRWINHNLQLHLSTIEELGSGAVYCQLIDSLYPGRVPLGKVNWQARHDYEYLHNYKLLQNAFERLAIDKAIDIVGLSKCRERDNLEMAQWIKRYIERQGGPDENYNPVTRRGNVYIDLPNRNSKKGNKYNMLGGYTRGQRSSHLLKRTSKAVSVMSASSSARKSYKSPDLFSLTLDNPFKPHNFGLHRTVSQTERQPLRQMHWPENIEPISPTYKDYKKLEKVDKIRKLLTSHDILEEEEVDFI